MPCARAIDTRTGSAVSKGSPLVYGHALAARASNRSKAIGSIPWSRTNMNSSGCWKCGCSSISLTEGSMRASAKRSRSFGMVMLEVPIWHAPEVHQLLHFGPVAMNSWWT